MESAYVKSLQTSLRYKNAIIGGVVFLAAVISGIALLLAGMQYSEVNNQITPLYIYSDRIMPSTPYVFYLGRNDSTAKVDLTISGDVSGYIGRVYRVWSLNNKPHTITCGSGLTFDGGNGVATFTGAVGDGMVFEFISDKRIAMISSTGVTLS